MKLTDFLIESDLLLEMGDDPLPWKWDRNPSETDSGSGEASFTNGEDVFSVHIYLSDGVASIFWNKNGLVTGRAKKGESQIRNMFTILDICKTYITLVKPPSIQFSADKPYTSREERNSRGNLYGAMVKRFATKLGYSSTIDDSNESHTEFELTRRVKRRERISQ